jgi:hypothetical protein
MKRLLTAVSLLTLAGCAAPQPQLPTRPSFDERRKLEAHIAERVSNEVSPRWVNPMLTIAQVESGVTCDPGGYAVGMFQILHPEAFGVSRREARQCETGISLGVAYLKRCLAAGAMTDAQLMACWNSGSPWTPIYRLERSYRALLARM